MKKEYTLTCKCGWQRFGIHSRIEAIAFAQHHKKDCKKFEIFIDELSMIDGEMQLNGVYSIIRKSIINK